jgi:ABC-type uncharacterized transport system ATPase component
VVLTLLRPLSDIRPAIGTIKVKMTCVKRYIAVLLVQGQGKCTLHPTVSGTLAMGQGQSRKLHATIPF